MAIVRAVKSGNWSDPTVWNTGALPTSADDVYSNTFTVTIDVSPTVLSISNAATTGVTVGGGFVLNPGLVLTCTASVGLRCNAATQLLSVTVNTGQTATIIGSVIGTDTVNSIGAIIANGSGGTLTITGNITGGAGSAGVSAIGLSITGAIVVNLTGNATGGGGAAAGVSLSNASATLNITGSIIGGSGATAYGVNTSVAGTISHAGSVIASSTCSGLTSSSASATLILSGPFITSANGVNPIYAARWFWQNATPPATYYQIRSANLSVIRPLYTADSVGGNPATSNVRSGTVYGPNNELTGTCAVPAAASVLAGVPVDNTTGTVTITAADIRAAIGLASANLDTQLAAKPTAAQAASAVRTELATELARLDTAISSRLATSGYTTPPTASAIASAVNSALDRTGFSLTSAERQAIATAVEQSILNESDGQAILNAIVGAIGNQNIDQVALVAAIRADLERSGGTLATRSTLTAAQVRTELAPELGNLDATVSSRLPSSGYTTPPTAAAIASAVWSAASRTLTALSDIATAVWTHASGRTITGGTVDTLTNAPTVPTPSQIASQVRTELSTELGRIDATVSSRLAPGGVLARVTLADTVTTLTNAPDVPTGPEIADAVRTELTPELARVANAATTQEVGDIVEAAMQLPGS